MTNIKKTREIRKLVKKKSIRPVSSTFEYEDQMDIRRQILEKITQTNLTNINSPTFDVKTVSNKNCENLIGKIEIPLGVAGPLKIQGDFFKGEVFVPLATTEGALVASVGRGSRAITESGGAHIFIEQYGISRAPVFRTKNLKEGRKFILWVKSHFKQIARRVRQTDRFLSLISVTPYIVGRNVFLRFVFDTGDAMGMNMATIACDSVIRTYIEKETKVRCIALSGNVCTDKKPSFMNKVEKRGYSVHADVLIRKKTVRKVLKSSPEKIVEVYLRKVLIGSAISGSLGFNAHHANIIAALFTATGQDLAHVVEGSLGTTTVEMVGDDLYFSVSLPSLPLGTVGGGTELGTQKEALSIVGIGGGGNPPGTNAKKLAEIVAATVLAGEVSLLAALASGDLAVAHKKLGRGETSDDQE